MLVGKSDGRILLKSVSVSHLLRVEQVFGHVCSLQTLEKRGHLVSFSFMELRWDTATRQAINETNVGACISMQKGVHYSQFVLQLFKSWSVVKNPLRYYYVFHKLF